MNQNLKKAKIVSLQGNGTYDSQYGMMYVWDISLDNGESGDYSSKMYTTIESLPFTIGTEIEYEYDLSKPEYPKIRKPQVAGSKRWTPGGSDNSFKASKTDPGVQAMICKQSSLQRSIEILKHNNHTKTIKLETVILLAQKLTDWVMEDFKIESPKSSPEQNQNPVIKQEPTIKPEPVPVLAEETEDDLPF
tara:strand:+ start:2091 stop:2663 length:573 start_codon:yes stop_codon:yes gene_type:complete